VTDGRARRRRPALSWPAVPASPAVLAIAAVAGLLTGAWVLRRRVAIVTVTGGSMLPAFAHGDRLLVRRASVRDLRPGQVVVFQQPGRGADPDGGAAWDEPPARWAARSGEWMIKRVVAVPGDVRPPDCPPLPVPPGALVPPDGFVVRGDNVAVSLDSRKLGCIPANRLLGIAQRRLPSARTAAAPAAGRTRAAAGIGSGEQEQSRR
jgi:signal peptidase I